MAWKTPPPLLSGTRPLIYQRNYKAAHVALHELWTKYAGTPGYVKADWQTLENAILRVANDGPDGEPAMGLNKAIRETVKRTAKK